MLVHGDEEPPKEGIRVVEMEGALSVHLSIKDS
jgi:hypothetical protein